MVSESSSARPLLARPRAGRLEPLAERRVAFPPALVWVPSLVNGAVAEHRGVLHLTSLVLITLLYYK